jgi:hypothetical protein
MNPLAHAANLGAGIASLAFFIAFILTLWPRRVLILAAAILFAVGTWASLGVLARNYFVMGAMAYGMSDSGYPNTVALFWLLLPLTIALYALFAPILLLPSIPQAIAMRLGIILNLTFIPLMAGFNLLEAYVGTQGHFLPDVLKWLVYALLWFRVRQNQVQNS